MPDQKPDVVKIYQRCGQCGGTGKIQPPEDPEGDCPTCEGEGYLEVFQVDMADIKDTLNDIMDKCNDIFEIVNVL